MPWFFVDDQLADNRKVRKAGTAALGLWVRAGSWSSAHLTDGFVPADVAARYGTARQAEKLVTAGLWEIVDRDGETGYQFHDWTDYQKTREQVRTRRAADADRQNQHRSGKGTNKTAPQNDPPNDPPNRGVNVPENANEKSDQSHEESQVNEACHGVTHDVSHGAPLPSPPAAPSNEGAAASGRGRTRKPSTSLAELASSAVQPTAYTLVAEWRQQYPEAPAYLPETLRELSKVADGLLRQGARPELIRVALDEWDARTDVHSPNALKWLYSDAVKAKRGTRSGRSDARPTRGDKVNGWLALDDDSDAAQPKSARGEKVRGWLDLDDADDDTPTLTAITGGKTA